MASNPSGYTTNYGIKKYADASDPGGTALNSNSDIIDAAIKAVADDVADLQASLLGYTEFTALITQSGTSAPTVTVLKNTTGATVSSINYLDVGWYNITFSEAILTASKTKNVRETVYYIDEADITREGRVYATRTSTTILDIATNDDSGTRANGILSSATYNYWIMELKIYP